MTDTEYTHKLNILKTHMLPLKMQIMNPRIIDNSPKKALNAMRKQFFKEMQNMNIERKVAERMWAHADAGIDQMLNCNMKNN